MELKIPAEITGVISALNKNGFEAYMVGGCVRDSILGMSPADYDICTDALPNETAGCFSGERIIETGAKHGTITVIIGDMPVEITTYRTDGDYGDNRRPDSVSFVKDLRQDLKRRDFTINAMAYSSDSGLIDPFGGADDLNAGLIRTVGEPDIRFSEDALRIMRALRFAAVLGFTIDDETARAMERNKSLLKKIAAERISGELNKLIMGKAVTDVLTKHIAVIGEVIPELLPAEGFRQNSPYHSYDVLTHILTSVDKAPQDVVIRLALLFHDIAKPHSYTEKNGIGHFYGHPQKSADIAENVLGRLRYDNKTIKSVITLVLYHDTEIKADNKSVKRRLSKIGETEFFRLIEVKRADTMAKAAWCQEEKLDEIEKTAELAKSIIADKECFSLETLGVNGNDIAELDIAKGHEIGEILNKLLHLVIDGLVENDRDELLQTAKMIRRGSHD